MWKFLKHIKQEEMNGVGGQAPAATTQVPTGQPVQQPQTPAATPTQPPTQAAETPTTQAPVTQAPVTPASPTDYNRSAADQVTELVVAAGLDSTQVTQAIMANGGQVTLDIYQALAKKHGEGVASLMASQFATLHASATAKATERDNAIYTQVAEAFKDNMVEGTDTGATVWAEISDWAKENVPNEERKELNKMIQQGGMAAQLAVQSLVARVQGASTFEQPAQLLDGDGLGGGGIKPIDRFTYTEELRKLTNKGHSYDSPQVKQLQRQRQVGMNRGL